MKMMSDSTSFFRPCIDLHEGRVKQLVGMSLHGKNGIEENFSAEGSPASFVEHYKNRNLTGGHIVMLGEGNETAAKEILQEWPGVFSIGGGMTVSKGIEFLKCGAKRIIFTSFLFTEDGQFFDEARLKELGNNFTPNNVVIDLSCRWINDRFRVMTKQWRVSSDLVLDVALLRRLENYASGFLVHAVDYEGFKSGVDVALIEMLADANVADVVYAGGVSTLQEIRKVIKHGKGRLAFTVGSALKLYGGELTLEDVLLASTSSAI